ncbi:DUF3592 domain-containing protein [Thiohalobacter sp. IOR34]|uniref:DUF3592 domain-containing protein n=1 Tax=Thiohalobacter sp. IOR34 TaxID=3057176 RepID=UPI0025B1DCA0|nr:DUF3592 domain-containing protein [Thiohalobacter sp. IOR34]WJW75449.1 DUF3592 domain-containing protein [Thiohalobacter sp. IOR34]
MALHAARNLALALRSRYWPTTVGKLEGVDIKRITALDEQYLRKGWVSEHLFGSYSYDVNGRQYRGKRITMSDNVVKPRSELLDIIGQYAHSGTCVVYYNPDKPQQACLIPGPRLWNYLPFVTALAFIAFPFIYQLMVR